MLDRCTDASEQIARACGVEVLVSDAGSVGAARALGFAHALGVAADLPHTSPASTSLARTWLASSDADTVVPPHWLTTQFAAAHAGADVLVGTVEPDEHLPAAERAAWLARHDLGEDHPHVHGANLGVRASAYVAVGGFAALGVHEDVDLVQRLRAHPGLVVRATDAHRVVTSSRLAARTEGGFATYLGRLRGVVGG